MPTDAEACLRSVAIDPRAVAAARPRGAAMGVPGRARALVPGHPVRRATR
jgi:hypothetical protein